MSIRETNLAVYGNRFNAYTELRLQRNRSTQISLLNGDVVAEHANLRRRRLGARVQRRRVGIRVAAADRQRRRDRDRR